MTIPLTKLLHPSDLEDEALEFPLRMLSQTEKALRFVGLLDDLPSPFRRWEYAQGLRALLKAKEDPIVLELGGSTSLFMPTVLRFGLVKHYVALDTGYNPGLPGANHLAGRAVQQAASVMTTWDPQIPLLNVVPHHALLPQGQTYDFIVAISMIENMAYGEDPAPEEGHFFMYSFLRDYVQLLNPGGVLFFTSDCGESQPDHYLFNNMRPPGIWDPHSWERVRDEFEQAGLDPIGETDFTWTTRAVYDSYTFASMCLRKRG